MKIYKIKNMHIINNYYKTIAKVNIEIATEIKKYIEILKKVSKSNNIYGISTEQYVANILFGKAKSKIIWDIEKAINIIKIKKIKQTKISTDSIYNKSMIIDKKKFNGIKENKAENKPIILATFIETEKPFIIDGTHRLYLKHKQNQKYIKAYILDKQNTIEALLNNEYKTIFKIFSNLTIISKEINKNNNIKLNQIKNLLPLN